MPTKFTKDTLPFLKTAHAQRSPTWLDEHQEQYEKILKTPFIELAKTFERELKPQNSRYHFPTKGIGRIKIPAFKVGRGDPHYKDWLSITASIPTGSRFERNPHLFFGILPQDPNWMGVIVSGGLYHPNSKQTKLVRQMIADDSEPFEKLFADRAFKARFKGGFFSNGVSPRVPRGFDPNHPHVDWLKLKNFMVVRRVSKTEFTSPNLGREIIKDFRQALRLNELLFEALT